MNHIKIVVFFAVGLIWCGAVVSTAWANATVSFRLTILPAKKMVIPAEMVKQDAEIEQKNVYRQAQGDIGRMVELKLDDKPPVKSGVIFDSSKDSDSGYVYIDKYG